MGDKMMNQLIAEIEELDNRIIIIHSKRGVTNQDEAQILKYRRCFLLDKLIGEINGNDDEYGEDDE